MPVLAGLPEPLALLEVGASAGLCLLPDFYAYDWSRQPEDRSPKHKARRTGPRGTEGRDPGHLPLLMATR
ncbi:MAG TPA: DUF2332 family protein [Roseiarcus sp.]